MRESEIAAIINTDVLINGDTAAACSLSNWYQKQHLLLASLCVTLLKAEEK